MKLHSFCIGTCLLALAPLARASLEQAPPSFAHKDGKAIFVDFTSAFHELTYDLINSTVTVESTIDFDAHDEGYPIFDLVPEPTTITLDETQTSAEQTADPDAQTNYRIVQQKVPAGHHQLKVSHSLATNVVFNDSGVASGFWLSDLNDRRYLESYLPSNLEYDQHPRKIKLNLRGAEGIPHVLKANGKVAKLSDGSFEVAYPEYFTSSSIFFHLFPEKSTVQNVQFYYQSIDGRLIPVDIYTIVDIGPWVQLTKDLLAELEADYGPFPHNEVLIFGNSLQKGGMEYSGATATGLLSLGHELFHSYNARGVMPANGNAGWMDEAMARWRDNMYPLIKDLTFDSTKIGGHSEWRRFTDRMAYTEGSAFLSRMAFRMDEKGLSLKTFLKDWYQKHMYSTVTTKQFETELTLATGLDLSEDFNRYVYGKVPTSKKKSFRMKRFESDPHHPVFTEEQLFKMTMP